MKFLHTSDLHLSSSLCSRLSEEKAALRKRELFRTFVRMCEQARAKNCRAFVIAGDLFDSENVRLLDAESVFNTIKSYPELTFLYLPGNHERDGLEGTGLDIPKNLLIFGRGWTYFELDGITFAGKSDMDTDLFSDFKVDGNRTTVLVLHGTLTDKARTAGEIGTRALSGLGIDYLALGHYHRFSETKIDSRTVAVYCGTPEGRGFDEAHECGFVTVDIGNTVKYEFVPFAARRIWDIEFDAGGFDSFYALERSLSERLRGISREDLIRVRLVGRRESDMIPDLSGVRSRIGEGFFYFEIIDDSRVATDALSYKNDQSLKGEFIRLALSCEELTEEEKRLVIKRGIDALSGEDLNS